MFMFYIIFIFGFWGWSIFGFVQNYIIKIGTRTAHAMIRTKSNPKSTRNFKYQNRIYISNSKSQNLNRSTESERISECPSLEKARQQISYYSVK